MTFGKVSYILYYAFWIFGIIYFWTTWNEMSDIKKYSIEFFLILLTPDFPIFSKSKKSEEIETIDLK